MMRDVARQFAARTGTRPAPRCEASRVAFSRMSLALFVALAAPALTGCDALQKTKSENPVFPPAPPRISLTNQATLGKVFGKGSKAGDTTETRTADADPEADATVVRASATEAPQGPKLDDSEVVATVNGQPIFASEVLDRYSVQLTLAQKQASAEEFADLRSMLLKRDLPGHIQQRILVQHLKGTLKPEQVKMLQSHLEGAFDAEIERLKKTTKANSRQELDEKLAKDGTSVESLRTAFLNQRMAFEYLGVKSKFDKKIGRRELFEYYEEHVADYSFPEKVKWQQFIVYFNKHGGKEKSYRTVQKALDKLEGGTEFADMIRKHSDGANKESGGAWDWMQRGSLDDEAVEQALFEMPVGKVSDVFVGKNAYQIVKVIDRKPAGKKPFEELQDEIRTKMEQENRKAASQKFLDEIREKALVVSPYVDNKSPTALQ